MCPFFVSEPHAPYFCEALLQTLLHYLHKDALNTSFSPLFPDTESMTGFPPFILGLKGTSCKSILPKYLLTLISLEWLLELCVGDVTWNPKATKEGGYRAPAEVALILLYNRYHHKLPHFANELIWPFELWKMCCWLFIICTCPACLTWLAMC